MGVSESGMKLIREATRIEETVERILSRADAGKDIDLLVFVLERNVDLIETYKARLESVLGSEKGEESRDKLERLLSWRKTKQKRGESPEKEQQRGTPFDPRDKGQLFLWIKDGVEKHTRDSVRGISVLRNIEDIYGADMGTLLVDVSGLPKYLFTFTKKSVLLAFDYLFANRDTDVSSVLAALLPECFLHSDRDVLLTELSQLCEGRGEEIGEIIRSNIEEIVERCIANGLSEDDLRVLFQARNISVVKYDKTEILFRRIKNATPESIDGIVGWVRDEKMETKNVALRVIYFARSMFKRKNSVLSFFLEERLIAMFLVILRTIDIGVCFGAMIGMCYEHIRSYRDESVLFDFFSTFLSRASILQKKEIFILLRKFSFSQRLLENLLLCAEEARRENRHGLLNELPLRVDGRKAKKEAAGQRRDTHRKQR
ncbi:MAG: uncharacterized protein A8A55_1082 [Amphiamblys sp. WSBS2006]|nr:MAG: uncharacterized protein A8A55_1082 [Amphiamblys sp. WSBS2006]